MSYIYMKKCTLRLSLWALISSSDTPSVNLFNNILVKNAKYGRRNCYILTDLFSLHFSVLKTWLIYITCFTLW